MEQPPRRLRPPRGDGGRGPSPPVEDQPAGGAALRWRRRIYGVPLRFRREVVERSAARELKAVLRSEFHHLRFGVRAVLMMVIIAAHLRTVRSL